jgi:hypothetical protein
MDKYSKQIIKFISQNKILEKKDIQNNLTSINFINIILEKVIKVNKNIKLPQFIIKNIPKLHDINEPPLSYIFFRQYKPEIKTVDDFIKYYCLNQHDFNLNKIKSSINDEKLLKLFEDIYERTDDRKELCQKFYQNTFVSIDVLQEIESFDLKHILIDESYYKLSIYYYDDCDINIYLKKIIKIIDLIKEINDHYEPNNNNTKYNVIIFLGNQKKQFIGNTITPISMNSGACVPEVYACVWRKEELEKVLIHELLHFINCDFHSHISGYDKIDKSITDLIKIEGTNNPNEAYNETVAGIINMCWKSVLLNININKIYYYEMHFLYLQSAKLIKYFNGNKLEDLLNNTITIDQTTSALSYLFLKMILFHYIIETCDFIKNINFKCNTSIKINDFSNFLTNKLSKINKSSCANNVNKYLDFIQINLNKDKYIYKTMRMSVI